MITYIIYTIAKLLAVSALCYLIFCVLIRRRASYRAQRAFLLSIPIFALSLSLSSIESIFIRVDSLTPVGDTLLQISNISHQSSQSNLDAHQPSESFPIQTPSTDIVIESNKVAKLPIKSSAKPPLAEALLVLWAVGVLVLIMRYVAGLYKIERLRRVAISSHGDDGIHIYKSSLVDGSFSFFHSIFINSELSGEKYDVVVMHERAHIQNYHFIDKSLVEIYTMIMWFNPVVWVVRHEIGAIHEFQADSAVLSGGCDIKQYKYFIFDEATGGVPAISNGFNNSLIKQRFIEMKERYQTKSSWLTRSVTAMAMVLLFVAASCTFVQQYTPATLSVENLPQDIAEGKITAKLKDGTTCSGSTKEVTLWLAQNASQVESIEVQSVKANEEDIKPEPPRFYIDDRQVHFIDKNDYAHISIYRRNGYTELDMMYEVYSDWYWVFYTSTTYLLDRESGERYNIIGIANDKPLNHLLVVRKHKGEYAMHTLIFPPIKEGVDRLDFVSGELPDSLRRPTNTMSRDYNADIKVNGDIDRPYRDSRNNGVIKISREDLPKNLEL